MSPAQLKAAVAHLSNLLRHERALRAADRSVAPSDGEIGEGVGGGGGGGGGGGVADSDGEDDDGLGGDVVGADEMADML